MADAEQTSPLAPVAVPPEKGSPVYERKMAPNAPGGRGPLRFEENIASDPAVPGDFVLGLRQGYMSKPGRPNLNENVFIKTAQETVQDRLHPGSAAWTESMDFMGMFAEGAGTQAEQRFVRDTRDGMHYNRPNPAKVVD